MNTSKELLLDIISLLRFPLIVLVVFIHVFPCMKGMVGDVFESYVCFYNIAYYCSEIIARVAVPLFFAISGFLYFYNVGSKLEWSVYKKKQIRRFSSLLVPYFFWNAIVIVEYMLMQELGFDVMKERILNYDWKDLLCLFWDMGLVREGVTGFPINYPLWFLRDLMIVTLISPLIFYGIKYMGSFFLSCIVVYKYIYI